MDLQQAYTEARLVLDSSLQQIQKQFRRYLDTPTEDTLAQIKFILDTIEFPVDLSFTNLVVICPHQVCIVHVNRTYIVASDYRVNLCLTLTPTPKGDHEIMLVHPNMIAESECNTSLISYAVRPIFDSIRRCQVSHQVIWGYQSLQMNIHRGDRLVFYPYHDLEYTITSCNDRYEIPMNPRYDILIGGSDHHDMPMITSGRYYFVSRRHKKVRLDVTVS